MIARIYVAPRENRKKGKFLTCYLIDGNLAPAQINKAVGALSNPLLEKFSINKLPLARSISYVLEIGYLPGVTDNLGHTAAETIRDTLGLNEATRLKIYSSKIFLIQGKASVAGVKGFADSLYNPLIERVLILSRTEFHNKKGLPLEAPEVLLQKRKPVIKVSLDVSDEDLIRLGNEGIPDENAIRRGPLALGLPEMKAIREHFSKLGRMPNDIELESLAQTWSEHCKHTIFANPLDELKGGLYKTYIQGATNLIRKKQKAKSKDICVSVFSDNSGAIVFDDKYLITHKVETHNTPSALDPFGGAITGIVGVNRDCIGFGLGAKPVANTYGFCFGNPEDTRSLYRDKTKTQRMFPPKRIIEGVIKGINAGGNTSGIPTVSGFVRFDERYRGKPLVFAGTVGLIPRKNKGKSLYEKKALAGDYIVMIGGRVGADGIHGATFSSVQMDSHSPSTAVQIGDPITQKKFSDALVKEARDMNLYSSITDNGAGGLSCSVAEMARECGGAHVELESVPTKYPGLRPWEIWISESQERMTLAVPKKKWRVLAALLKSRGVEATVIGKFNNSGKMTVSWKGAMVLNLSLAFLHDGWPRKHLKTRVVSPRHETLKISAKANYTPDLEKLIAALNVGGFAFISEQYDHEVQAGSVLKPLSGPGRINTDAQVFRPLLSSERAVVLSLGVCPYYSDIDTYQMAACAIDTAVRAAVCAGAPLAHLAILDNFCWCSSDDKKRLYQLKNSAAACYAYALGYGTPFISGKDSMYNDFKGYDGAGKPVKISIPPTLLISAIGVMPDIHKAISPEFKVSGDAIYLLGKTHDELGASEYARMLGGLGGSVPKVAAEKNFKIYSALEKAIGSGLLASAMSVSLGGLGAALTRACIGGVLGADITLSKLPGKARTADRKLFSESQGRVLVSVAPGRIKEFEKLVKKIPHAKLGIVNKTGKLTIADGKKIVDASVKKLHDLYHKFSNTMKQSS